MIFLSNFTKDEIIKFILDKNNQIFEYIFDDLYIHLYIKYKKI